ncbi:MAG: sigma-70 family RNA polymerase sigma factor [Planctomycetia bacterium]|nr:sigma-70 family RNA polymerase sigma factor [Planctomycetia bacterium]
MSNDQHHQFHELFVRHQGRIYAYIATLLPNRSGADEVFSDTSLVLWKKFGAFDTTREFLPWARAVAFNEVRNYRRRKHHKEVLLSDEMLGMLAQTREQDDEWFETRSKALQQCMEGLLPEERDVLEQYYVAGSNAKSVAKALKTTPAAIYMKMYRIRQYLHECIDHRVCSLQRDGNV